MSIGRFFGKMTVTAAGLILAAAVMCGPSIDGAEVELSKTSFTYNGKVQKPTITSVGGRAFSDELYAVEWSKSSKNVGTYTVRITGKDDIKGTTTATYQIVKAANPMKVKAKVVKVKAKKLKKKAQKIKATKAFNINKKTGKITVKVR